MGSFLTAEWRKLVLANYTVDPDILKPFIPAKTELDLWNGSCYVSLVGFMFLNTKLLGIPIPFHRNFEEVNLRFYVKYNDNGEWKRGVVFIKEIVPKPALTFVARSVYNEPYETMPMRHSWKNTEDALQVEYAWKRKKWHRMKVEANPAVMNISEGSEAEFISEHYWGYTKVDENKTSEYEVLHPKWHIYEVKNHSIEVDFGIIYGDSFDFLNSQSPKSVFLAEGSAISVEKGRTI